MGRTKGWGGRYRIGYGLCLVLVATLPTSSAWASGPPEGSPEDVVQALRSATPVADAAEAGDDDLLRRLLRNGEDPNAARGDGFTALHVAARENRADLVEMLVYAGAHLEARTRLGAHTPLHVAAGRGSTAALRELVRAGAEVDAATATGATALMLAAAAGDVGAIDLLVPAGANLWGRESAHHQTPLHFAAAKGRTDAVRRLVELGAETCATTAIHDAVAAEAASRKLLMTKLARLRALNEEQKKDAAETSGGEDAGEAGASKDRAVNRLTADDPERGKAGRSGFRWPWQRGRKQEKDPPGPLSYGELVGRTGGMTPLHYAARQGHRSTVEVLLDAGADVDHVTDGDRSTPLLVAVVNGHFDLAMDLLERGADPDLASSAGVAPLYAAVNVAWAPHAFYPQPTAQHLQQITHLELMEALLDAGADPDARLRRKVWYTGYNFDQSGVDETGATAFWRAAQSLDVEAMRLLFSRGADPTIASLVVPERRAPNGRNADRELLADDPQLGDPAVTPFQVASGAGYVGNFHRLAPGGFLPALRYFVEELGADVDAADWKGWTPLHNAAMRGDNAAIIYLILHGADPHGVTRDGDNVADLANGPVQRIQPFPETLELLAALGVHHNDRCVSC